MVILRSTLSAEQPQKDREDYAKRQREFTRLVGDFVSMVNGDGFSCDHGVHGARTLGAIAFHDKPDPRQWIDQGNNYYTPGAGLPMSIFLEFFTMSQDGMDSHGAEPVAFAKRTVYPTLIHTTAGELYALYSQAVTEDDLTHCNMDYWEVVGNDALDHLWGGKG